MATGKPQKVSATDLATIKRVVRGVIYGEVEREFVEDTAKSLEFFINGVSIGTTTVEPEMFGGKDVYEFNFLILPSFLFEAPVNIRMREVETGEEIGEPLVLREVEETRAAVQIADGAVAGLERGSLKGGISEVNPDALPITVVAYARGAPIARTVIGAKMGAKTAPVAPGNLISLLPFSIGLPPSILDGGSTSISVRIDGSSQEFVGSPLLIRFDTGDGLHDRLSHLEQRNQELEAEVLQLRDSIVADVAEQFYRYIVPRVDALLAIQREGLEGQMLALWRELSPEGPAPLTRRQLPDDVAISLSKPFTGFRWSEPILGQPSDRWFASSGFVATEISAKHDLLLVAKGALAVAPAAWERLTVTANGHKIGAQAFADGEGWRVVGLVPRDALAASGALALLFETPVAGAHKLAPTAAGAVSLSLASVELTGLAAAAPAYAVDQPTHFPFGWHPLEESPKQGKFRWMGSQGVVALTGLPSGAPLVVTVRGPMALGAALSQASAELNGERPRSARVETQEGAWTLRLEFAARTKPGVGLLCLRAQAKEPSATDRRLLSLAVSDVAVTLHAEPAVSPVTAEAPKPAPEAPKLAPAVEAIVREAPAVAPEPPPESAPL